MKLKVRLLLLAVALVWSVGCSENPGGGADSGSGENGQTSDNDGKGGKTDGPGSGGPGSGGKTDGPGSGGPGNKNQTDGPGSGGPGGGGPGGGDTGPRCENGVVVGGLLSRWGDADGDGIFNIEDKCPCVPVPDGKSNHDDRDDDNVGDECDNCPDAANASQENICNSEATDYKQSPSLDYVSKDSDGDGIPDIKDNCPGVASTDLTDSDGDGVGDICDNCPDVKNPFQIRSDKSKPYGDACAPVAAGPDCSGTGTCADNSLSCIKNVCVCDNDSIDATLLKPSVVLVLDGSGSMKDRPASFFNWTPVYKTTRLFEALDSLADNSWNSVRYGVIIYSSGIKYRSNYNAATQKGTLEEYPSAAALKAVWHDNYVADGQTYTSQAVDAVTQYINPASDPYYNKRSKLAVVVTDGAATENKSLLPQAVKRLADQEIDTVFIGIELNGNTETELKKAQGKAFKTKNIINTNVSTDSTQLATAIKDAATADVNCDLVLGKTPSDPNQIWLYVNDQVKPRGTADTWDYDAAKNAVVLKGDLCTQVKSTTSSNSVEVIVGCAGTCQVDPKFNGTTEDPRQVDPADLPPGAPKTHWCDGIDNNCDGTVDEGCDLCVPEKCDGTDNDCDGVIDNGCDLKGLGESCTSDAECFNSICDEKEKKCTEVCRPVGTACTDNGQCCSKSCSSDGTCNLG